MVRLETDLDGTTYLRVTEPTGFNPLDGVNPLKVIKDTTLGPGPGINNIIANVASAEVGNVNVVSMKHGLMLQYTGTTWIHDYTYKKFDGGGDIYGAAIKLGDASGLATQTVTYIQRVSADGQQAADPTYKVSNTDFIGIEGKSGPVYIRDVTGKNFGDAGIDSKSNKIYVMNATLDSGHRMIRAWQGVDIVLVNSIVNAAPGNSQGAIFDTTGSVHYYNTLWCQGAKPATADSANCSATPWAIEGEDLTFGVVAGRFIPMSSNPLPPINPMFRTSIDQIVVEYSSNGGQSWGVLPTVNSGSPGKPPVGDTRYAIPANLKTASYQFRAYYMLNGARTGGTSSIVDGTGKAIG